MHILLGVANFGEAEEKMLLHAAEEAGVEVTVCERRYTKAGIMQYLDDHRDTDVVVLSEAVGGTSPFIASDYELLAERHEHVRVIPILMDERCGTDYVRDVFYSGIYNAIFSKDADLAMVLHLMATGRSRKEAKIYYRLDSVEDVSNAANIERCVSRIEGAPSDEEFHQRVMHIYQMLTVEEFQEVLRKLNPDVLDKMRALPQVGALIPEKVTDMPGVSQKGRILSSLASAFSGAQHPASHGEMHEEYIRQPDPVSQGLRMNALSVDDLFDIISNVIIGFVGNQRRSGVTHQAIIAAHYLAARGYRVALADCATRSGKSMCAFEAIEKYRDTVSRTDGFSYLGVDYYTNVTTESLNRIFSAAETYHFVVIDYGVFSPYVKADIGRCTIKCAVCGSMPWEVNQLRAFADDTKFLRGQIVYLIRGVAPDARDRQEWLKDIIDNYRFADVQEDPFNGECYAALAEMFDKYVKGLPVQDQGVDASVRTNYVADITSGADVVRQPTPSEQDPVGKVRWIRRKKEKCKQPEKEAEYIKPVKSVLRRKVSGSYFVASLKHGAGCTYAAAVIANVLAEHGESICLVTDDEGVSEYVRGGVALAYWNDGIDHVFADYRIVVMDGGVVDGMSSDKQRERNRASKKIMVCRSGEEHMRTLAGFAAGEEDEGAGWYYLFNQIPPADRTKVCRIMDAYDIGFVPLVNAIKPSKETRKIILEFL